MLEIEKKFLINEVPENIESCEKQEILQGYFKENQKNIRIRKTVIEKKGRKYITYTMTKKTGNGLIRQEEEKKISENQFKDYREFAKDNQIRKTRYLYPYKKNIIEINQFHDSLDGLRMAEIEFWSIEKSNKFIPPSRCSQEVTERKEANNSYLAVHGMNKLIKNTHFENTLTRFQLKSFYNQEAKKYTQTRTKHRNDAEKIINTIQNYPKKEIKLIEVGCWSWRLLQHLEHIINKKITYIGVDISENLLEEAKKIPTKQHITSSFVCKDMISYLRECKQESVDIIVGIASFQHLINKKERFLAAKYMYRNLVYEGIIIMTNRSFSLRMIKKHRKTLRESFRKKLFYRNKNEWNNLMIPRKTDHNIHRRFYHIFTKKELKEVFLQSWFVIQDLSFLTKEWKDTNTWQNSSNTMIIAKKTIFTP